MTFLASTPTIINRFLRVGMSLITTYYFLNLKFTGNIYLWLYDSDWTKEGLNEIFKNGIAFWWIIFLLLSYFVFYVIIPIIIHLISDRIVYRFIENKISSLGDNSTKYKRLVRFISNRNITKYVGKKNIDSLTASDRDNFSDTITNIVCYLSHFLLCWIFLDINNSWQIILTIILTTLIVLIFTILFYPLTHIFNFPSSYQNK